MAFALENPQAEERPHILEKRKYVPHCPQEEFIVPLLRTEIESRIRSFASGSPQRVLDVGCGQQPFRKFLEEHGFNYLSCDVNQTPNGTVDFVCEIDGELPGGLAAKEPFDLLLCTEVLEHVANWPKAFQNIAWLLRAGGRALITVPHFYQLHEEPYDFWRPTLHAIRYYAARSGLIVKEARATGDAWDVLGTVMANFRPEPKGEGIFDQTLATGLRVVRRVVFRLLAARVLQKRVNLAGPLYMSNVVVLTRG